MLKKIIDVIQSNQSFALTTHYNPDGDAVGSLVAMAAFLGDLGKEVHAYYTGHLTATYGFLNTDGDLACYEETSEADSEIARADVVILLDANEWSRTDKMETAIRDSSALKLVIDHHPLEGNSSDAIWVDKTAASVGEMIFRLIKEMDGKITQKIGVALYVTILTDTGSFRFSNTTAETHRIASELIEAGVSTSSVYQKIYERNPVEKVKLLGYCIENIHLGCNNLLAWTSVSQKALTQHNAEDWMLDGVVEVVRTITDVEVTVLLKELKDGGVKISLRSSEKLDVNKLARSMGGGGHPRAAGCKLDMELEEAQRLVVKKVREGLEEIDSP